MDSTLPARPASSSLSTTAVHADESFNHTSTDVAPALHVSTTFRYTSIPEDLVPASQQAETLFSNPITTHDSHVYSRETAPNTARLETTLSALLHGRSITYASGLAAIHALLVFLNPKRIAIGQGYHGTHGVIGIHSRLTGLKTLPLECPDEDLHEGDIIHVESPINPTGEAIDMAAYAQKARRRGAYLVVDSTFAPPPLQDPFVQGADVVMHSGTKYFGGHSDMLCGVLAIADRHKDWYKELILQRTYLGNVMGSLEGWLGLRSIRTLELRIQRQSETAVQLVQWLSNSMAEGVVGKVVEKVFHASLQQDAWVKKQMPGGYGPVFALLMKDEAMAKKLPSLLQLFAHATSLGGVESLVEWRTMSDDTCDRKLMRISVGIEGWQDLKADLEQGFEKLLK